MQLLYCLRVNFMKLNEFIALIRESSGYTQENFAGLFNLSRSAIDKFEKKGFGISKEHIESITKKLNINTRIINDNSVYPFYKDNFYKLFMLTRGLVPGFPGYEPLYSIIKHAKNVKLILLKPELSGFKKYLDRSLFETPTYAIIVKDDKNNIFVLRRKKDTDMIMLGGGLENPLVKISEIAKSESIEISLSISVQSISEEQYDMLKKWEPVQRENVEPFFKNTKFSKIYEPSDEEILLLKKIKDSDFKISDLIKYIDKKIK